MSAKGKSLKIRWRRLVLDGETCPRCSSTEEELEKAVSMLKQALSQLGIEVILEKEKLSVKEFENDPLESNRIWINDRPLEEYFGGNVGKSPCCNVCEPYECRTVKIGEQVYETIPSEIIVRAGFAAAIQLLNLGCGKNCCEEAECQ
ncbi:MAG: DUF2703 domain-containing protein [Nitrososphaeria archaeon]|nr:DUF2703 domain-containing protein [Nitrososphaeria archaeon]